MAVQFSQLPTRLATQPVSSNLKKVNNKVEICESVGFLTFYSGLDIINRTNMKAKLRLLIFGISVILLPSLLYLIKSTFVSIFLIGKIRICRI